LRILEIGCGAGGLLGPLQRYGTVHGIDIDRDYIDFCRKRGFDRVLCGSGYELPFPDASFDLVCLFDTIEHIPNEADALREIHRVLKPGGRAFFSVPAYQWLWSQNDRIAHHCRRYTAHRLKRALRTAGFRIRRTTYFNSFLFPMIAPAIVTLKLREFFGLLPANYNNTSVHLPATINSIFKFIMSSERWVLRWVSFPAGHSLIAIVEKQCSKVSLGS
jgi:SAM-dependent methyltransferase